MMIALLSLIALAGVPQPATHAEMKTLAEELLRRPKTRRPADVPLAHPGAMCGSLQDPLPGVEPGLVAALHKQCVILAAQITHESLIKPDSSGGLRVVEVAGRPLLVLRQEDANGALGYTLLRAAAADGRVFVASVRFVSTGFGLPSTLALVRERARRFGPDAVAHSRQLHRAVELTGQGAPEQALQVLASLPEEYRDDYGFCTAELGATRSLGGDPFTASAAACLERWPNDPMIAAAMFDPFLESGQLDNAVAMARVLRTATADDPGALAMEGFANLRAGELVAARQLFADAKRGAPKMLLAINGLVRVDLAEGNFDEAVAGMKSMAEMFGTAWSPDVGEVPGYEAFTKSKQHAKWLKWVRKHHKQP